MTDHLPISEHDERLWAAIAHGSILLNLVTGFLGVLAPLVIYLVYKDRSRHIAFHAMQSFIFQLIWWVGAGFLVGLAWAVTGILSAFLIGLLCIPGAGLISFLPLVGIVWGVIAAIQCYNGSDFRYWLVADWVKI